MRFRAIQTFHAGVQIISVESRNVFDQQSRELASPEQPPEILDRWARTVYLENKNIDLVGWVGHTAFTRASIF